MRQAGPHDIKLPPTMVGPSAPNPRPQVLFEHVDQLHLHVGPSGVQGLGYLTGTG
ncbi:MAG: hypothetical protein J4G03_09005 [Gemmatimonadetes bacterium]|nr:hypothetical protein [Gemmatimonadota bacterium]